MADRSGYEVIPTRIDGCPARTLACVGGVTCCSRNRRAVQAQPPPPFSQRSCTRSHLGITRRVNLSLRVHSPCFGADVFAPSGYGISRKRRASPSRASCISSSVRCGALTTLMHAFDGMDAALKTDRHFPPHSHKKPNSVPAPRHSGSLPPIVPPRRREDDRDSLLAVRLVAMALALLRAAVRTDWG